MDLLQEKCLETDYKESTEHRTGENLKLRVNNSSQKTGLVLDKRTMALTFHR